MSTTQTPTLSWNAIEKVIFYAANTLVNAIDTVQTTASRIAIKNAYYYSIRISRHNIDRSDVIDPTVLVRAAFISSLKKSIKEADAELAAAREALEAKAKTTAELIATLDAAISVVRVTETDIDTKH
jgi:hypothetical protein